MEVSENESNIHENSDEKNEKSPKDEVAGESKNGDMSGVKQMNNNENSSEEENDDWKKKMKLKVGMITRTHVERVKC